jgi:hypothetical protein
MGLAPRQSPMVLMQTLPGTEQIDVIMRLGDIGTG